MFLFLRIFFNKNNFVILSLDFFNCFVIEQMLFDRSHWFFLFSFFLFYFIF